MPVRVSCPHCRTPCLVAEQHLGVPVKCGRCGRTFTTRADPSSKSPPARLDLGAAASPTGGRQAKEHRFLVQHLVRSNLDDRHELAVLVVADGSQAIPAAAAALAPLLGQVLDGASKDAGNAAESISAACKNLGSTVAVVVIWNGQVSMGVVGDCPIYHLNGGRLTRLRRGPMKLAAGDWLVIACEDLLDERTLQAELGTARSSAVELAQRLVGHTRGASFAVVVVRGY
ncbi:MAG TPA: MJ0042-type zinc finger domain-containing protein [Gemmataceae bacterium]|nr:MJ0042-type zinc finger domain-containing protein [Gemmataceae bacterium]